MITLLAITAISLTSVWYHESNSMMNSYVEETATSLMKDAYNAFSYLLNDAEYLSSLIIMNKENIITPLQIINAESKDGNTQLTYNQLVNKRLIDSYIGSMYGHKYYITGISVVSTSGYLFKTGEAIYYPFDIIGKLEEYGVSKNEKRMVLLPPVDYDSSTTQKRFVVPAVRNIMSIDEKLAGFVIVYFDYMIIKDIFSNNLPPNSRFEVHDRLGKTIFSNVDDNIARENKRDSVYVQSHYYAEKAGWEFDMAIPTNALQGRLYSTIRRTLVIMFAIALIAIASGVFAVYRMTSNLEELNRAMFDVSQGNLDSRAEIEGKDEIGRMGSIFNQMVDEVKKLLERISEEEKQKRITEIDFLQAQINPHFVSNALNTIMWMAKMSNAENIVSLTKSLNTLMQSSMRRGSEFIPVYDEIAYTKNYVEIQKYSAFYEFEIDFFIKDDLKSLYTPRFVIQPLVENAIIHGFSDSRDGRRIEVSLFRTGGCLQIEVFDNGKGMKQSQIEKIMNGKRKSKNTYNSIGINNIHERIKLFFGEKYGLSFESAEDKYTKAILLIPVLTTSDWGNAHEQ
ncbi:MAG: histidine kinase [Dysgonamonadaceae bacterium]|nr:histidine kinase [Dysgonamonadaceae bacterium]